MTPETAPTSADSHDVENNELPELPAKNLAEHGHPSLVDLPLDILHHIAERVAWSAAPGRQGEALMSVMLVHSKLLSAGLRVFWKTLEFYDLLRQTPVRVPTHTVLLKYGSFVQSILIKSSDPCEDCARCTRRHRDVERDMDASTNHSNQQLTSAAFTQVLALCTGLRDLSFGPYFPCPAGYDRDIGRSWEIVANLGCFSTPNLKNLRTLTVDSLSEATVSKMIAGLPLLESLTCIWLSEARSSPLGPAAAGTLLAAQLSQLNHLTKLRFQGASDEFVIQTISHCPMLETLFHSRFGRYYSYRHQIHLQPPPSLGSHISRLKHLTQLELDHYNLLNESWLEHDWPQTITNINISWCPKFSLQDTPSFLRRAAPNLTHLKLYVANDYNRTTDWSELDHVSFDSAGLTHLHICAVGGNADLISWFRDSKNIEDLEYNELKEFDLRSLSRLLSASTWPNLHRLKLTYFDALEPDNQYRREIKEYCDSHYISFFQKD